MVLSQVEVHNYPKTCRESLETSKKTEFLGTKGARVDIGQSVHGYHQDSDVRDEHIGRESFVLKVCEEREQLPSNILDNLSESYFSSGFVADLNKIPNSFKEKKMKKYEYFFRQYGQGLVRTAYRGGEMFFKTSVENIDSTAGLVQAGSLSVGGGLLPS